MPAQHKPNHTSSSCRHILASPLLWSEDPFPPEARPVTWQPDKTPTHRSSPSIILTIPPLLITTSQPTSLIDAFYTIRGQAIILNSRDQTNSLKIRQKPPILLETRPASWIPEEPHPAQKAHVAKTSSSNLDSNALLDWNPSRPSEDQFSMKLEIIFSTTGYECQKTTEEAKTKEENTCPKRQIWKLALRPMKLQI